MEQDLLEAKNYLSQQGYGSGTNYTTNLVAVLLANYAQEKVKKLQQHGGMQAEGSDGVSGAAVGNSAAGQSRRDSCWFRNRGRGKRCKCTSKCLLED